MAAISLTGRQALHDYKYQSTMKGWLDLNVMDPFWERVVLWFPLSVAPNVITFVGGIQYIVSTFVLSTHCPDFETSVETWLCYMLGVSLFVYQTMDAIDGKQARRTKQSSPLGQLFDHGIDALICTFFFVNTLAILQMGTNWIFISILMAGYTAFFMVNWRARHCGIMHFGIIGVTEGEHFCIMMAIITGAFGPSIWNISVLGVNVNYLGNFAATLGSLYSSVNAYFAVQKYYKQNPKKEDPGRVYELLHLALFIMGFVCWNLCDVFTDYPWTYLWIAALVFSGIIHRLIVADVTHMKSAKYYSLLNPLCVMVFGSLFEYAMNVENAQSVMNSPHMVYGILVYVLVFWLTYVFKVIHEICDTLSIGLFVINPP
eukprot:467659_1